MFLASRQAPAPEGWPARPRSATPPPRGGNERRRGPAVWGEPIRRKVGLTLNSGGVQDGYILLPLKHYLRTYLMTNDGRVVNTWDSRHPPGQSAYLLENGHLLRACHTRAGGVIGGGEGGRIEEHDWEGNLVWSYDCADDRKVMHHDIEPLPNGNVLALVVEYRLNAECIAAGFDPRMLRNGCLLPEYVIEIEKVGKTGGKIVWQWHVWDHLVQDNDPKKANYGKVSEHPELISVEVNGRMNKAFWNHANSIDYNAERDEIMISARACSELWVIDHGTTTEEAAGHTGGRRGKGGDLLFRWGNPAAYNRGTARDKRLFDQHDCQWIEAGRPGAGHIMAYNNGLFRPEPGSTEPVLRRKGSWNLFATPPASKKSHTRATL